MQQIKFRYDITIELEFTGAELALLMVVSRAHYDIECKDFFTPGRAIGGRGAFWRSDFRTTHGMDPEAPEAKEKTIRIQANSTDVSRCQKMLSVASGCGIPHTQHLPLSSALRNAFDALQREYQRLNPPEIGV